MDGMPDRGDVVGTDSRVASHGHSPSGTRTGRPWSRALRWPRRPTSDKARDAETADHTARANEDFYRFFSEPLAVLFILPWRAGGRRGRQMRSLRCGAIVGAIFLFLSFVWMPSASAHGKCYDSGGLEWAAGSFGVVYVKGNAQFKCDYAHDHSAVRILLQTKSGGSWHTPADSGRVTDCCNKATWTVSTGWGTCLAVERTYEWRVWIDYWYIYNGAGDIKHYRVTTNAWSGQFSCYNGH